MSRTARWACRYPGWDLRYGWRQYPGQSAAHGRDMATFTGAGACRNSCVGRDSCGSSGEKYHLATRDDGGNECNQRALAPLACFPVSPVSQSVFNKCLFWKKMRGGCQRKKITEKNARQLQERPYLCQCSYFYHPDLPNC